MKIVLFVFYIMKVKEIVIIIKGFKLLLCSEVFLS